MKKINFKSKTTKFILHTTTTVLILICLFFFLKCSLNKQKNEFNDAIQTKSNELIENIKSNQDKIQSLEEQLTNLQKENDSLKEKNDNLEKTIDKLKTSKVTSRSSTTSRSSSTTKVNNNNNTKNNGWTTATVTAYCSCSKCCGKSTGITASGTKATAGRTIAASSQYAFGTKIEIQGYGTYTVEDRGGAIQGNRIDMYFNSHSEALAFGKKTLSIRVVN